MKIGIEVHQRLATKKLFCSCDTTIAENSKPDATITRRLHPVFSELGEVDEASQAEFSKDRAFEYQIFRKNNCPVEMDEEPPHPLNPEALAIALNIALQLNSTPADEVHIMRKTVIDGSNTSGFQRTAIVAFNGHIDSSKGSVRIPLIAIEEESCGIVSADGQKATYSLDRLGIPLVEITTSPDIKDGSHLQEVAEKIGMILRATGKVARGIGTIRQDVNISTEGGARVEIKGSQELKMLPTLVENEEKRQLELVKIIAQLRQLKAFPVKKHLVDLSSIFKATKAALLSNGIKAGATIVAQKLPGHKGILGRTIQPGRRYGTELSDYAKRAGVKGIIHSDEDLAKYGILEHELAKLKNELVIEDNDAFVLVVAPKEQAEKAMGFVLERANMDSVPEETRRANPDGTTSYMRPLPGKARLYPETDVPPIPITEELLAGVEKTESLEKKKERLEKMLNKEMAARIIRSRHLHIFEKLAKEGADPMLAAATIEDTVVALRREGFELPDLEKALTDLFSEYAKGIFVKAAIPEILKGMAKGARAEAVIKVMRLQKISGDMLAKIADECNWDMKAIMQKYRLQVDPTEVSAIIAKRKKAGKSGSDNPAYL